MTDPADANDADALRFAADHARHLAGEALAWEADTRQSTPGVYAQGAEPRMIAPTTDSHTLHIATWSPQVAHLVADWLDQHARAHQPVEPWVDDPYECWLDEHTCAALALARALLGEGR